MGPTDSYRHLAEQCLAEYDMSPDVDVALGRQIALLPSHSLTSPVGRA